MRGQWRQAKKYGTRRDLMESAWDGFWERFWHCWVSRQHHEKMGSHGACYRCGKAMR